MTQAKVLLLDIETAPNVAFIWKLFDNYISPDQLVSTSHILCWSAKWLGEKDIYYGSIVGCGRDNMLRRIHELISEADFVVHYNGTKFDMPTINREFLTEGMPPASPVKQVDLLKVVRRQFRFSSNKLDFVCQQLGLGNKVHHKGMGLWRDCMAGDEKAWKVMERYNKQDVVLLEKLYRKLLPWIPSHPNITLYTQLPDSCPRCGSKKFQSRGTAHTATMAYKRYQCTSCEGWFKGEREAHPSVKHRPIN